MKRIAVIGCGLRADCYLHQLKDGIGKEWKIEALADPSPVALEVYLKLYGDSNTKTFPTGPDLLRVMKNKINAVIIASPNRLHIESVIPALKEKLIILLEKPVATTIDDCATMWRAYNDAGMPPLLVGFVLRYTAFYRKVKEIIKSGAIGQVLSIEATEMMGAPLTAMFARGWRRNEKLAGPLILEKCCHDMDILRWLANAPVSKISSFGLRTVFIPKPEASLNCKDCKFKNRCRYSALNVSPYLIDGGRKDEIQCLIPSDNDLCVYNSDKDIVDHQTVNIEFENGILVVYTVCMDQPKTTRTIKVNGTKGQIIGDVGEDELQVKYHLKKGSEGYIIENIPIIHDESGHHGGDSVIAEQFKRMLRGEFFKPSSGLYEGIEACLIALSAEKSMIENRVIDMKDIYGIYFG